MLAGAESLALDYPRWSGFTSGVTPQTVVFTNHGTLTVSNAVGMSANYPQYYLLSGLDNMPVPFTNTLPALWPRGSGAFSWSVSFVPPLNESDYIILSDVDNDESATIRAYDVTGLPVSVTNWSVTLLDPILPNAGFQGIVTRLTNQIHIAGASPDTSEELAIFQPAAGQLVGRLDYEYQNTPLGGGPTIAFATGDCGCCPQLQVERQATDVVVSWPVSGSNCLLQTSIHLSPATWTNWPAAPSVAGNRLQNVVNDDQNTRFFRLKRQ